RDSADAHRERLAGLAPPLHVRLPSADDLVQDAAMVYPPFAFAERQIIIDVDHCPVTDIVTGLTPLIFDRDKCGLLVSADISAQQITCVVEGVRPGITAHEGQPIAVALLHHYLQ